MSVASSNRPLGQPFSPTSIAGDSPGGAGAAGAITVLLLAVSSVFLLQGSESQRYTLVISIAVILFGLNSYSPRLGIPAMLVFLAAVGGIKRWLMPMLGYTSFDPLLLVAPFVVGINFVTLLVHRSVPRDTLISKIVVTLVIWMALEMFNPLQGGLTVGLAGGLFYVVPVLWYYVGRMNGTPEVNAVTMKVVHVVALLGALYGLYQTWYGFSPVEREWLAVTGNDAGLYLTNGIMRVFSFFSSFAEYAQFLGLAAILSFCLILQKYRPAVIPFAFFAMTVLLSSSRGIMAGMLFTCTVLWAIQGKTPRSWLPRLTVAAVCGIVALAVSLTQIQSAAVDPVAKGLIDHQAKGLLAPMDQKASTGSSHMNLVVGGIAAGFRNPLGQGLGITTIAAGKFGVVTEGTESDFGNMFVSLGAGGGMLYTFLIGYVLWRSVMLWHESRSLEALQRVGIFVGSIGFWLMGGHYAATMLVWFLIGGMDRHEFVALRIRMKELAEKRRALLEKRREIHRLRTLRVPEMGVAEGAEASSEPPAGSGPGAAVASA